MTRPDGRVLAALGIGRVDAAPNAALRLTAALFALGVWLLSGDLASAAFPGQNGRIAFNASHGNGTSSAIYVVNTDGSGQRKLTTGPGPAGAFEPAWSSDGKRIAFSAPGGTSSAIYVMNADGSGQTKLTGGTAYDTSPAWSPDGKKIAFTGPGAARAQAVYVMNADGSGERRLTRGESSAGEPAWSPDGKRIAFVVTFGTLGSNQIYVIDADGSGLAKLANGTEPAWSPDGKKIAFARRNSSGGGGNIYVSNADGSGAARLTNTDPVVGEDNSPAWSPDGSKIAFVGTRRAAARQLYIVNADGSGLKQLTHDGSDKASPDWQPLAGVPGGGGGPPQPTCAHHSVRFGPVTADAACFKQVGGAWVASGRVRLGGLDIVPSGSITVDPDALAISAKGAVDVQLDVPFQSQPLTLYHGALDWNFKASLKIELHLNHEAEIEGFPIEGKPTARCKDGTYSFSKHRSGTCSHHGGVAEWNPEPMQAGHSVEATASLELTAEGVKIGAKVDLPDVFGDVSGDVTLRVTRDHGLELDELNVTAGGFDLGPLQASDLALSYDGKEHRWKGAATVAFTSKIPFTIGGAVSIKDGRFESANAEVGRINKLIADGVFLQRLRFGVALEPNFSLSGGMGLSAGPQIGGKEAASLDGDMTYTQGNPSTFAIKGTLRLVSEEVASAHVEYRTNGQVDFGGELNFTKEGFGVKGGVNGFIDGASSFDAEGNAEIVAFGHDVLGGDALVSSKGIAGCGHIPIPFNTWDVGLGYYWGGEFDAMEHACDVGPWRVTRSSSTFGLLGDQLVHPETLPTPVNVVLPAHLPGAVFAAIGTSAPPKVTLVGPDGRTIATPPDPTGVVSGGSVLLIQDPRNRTTYIAVGAPVAGSWSLSLQAGSSPLEQVREADGLAAPRVSASVGGHGQRRILSWQLTPAPGQRVVFFERGRTSSRVITTTASARGSVHFTPEGGRPGRRAILASVQEDGLVRRVLTVASYVASRPPLPARPSAVHARRRGSTLLVGWRAAGRARRYVVSITLLDGRQLMFFEPSGRRSVVVRRLLPYDPGVVQISGVDRDGRRGPVARAKVPARTGRL